MKKEYYSNCLIEAIKAKFHDWNNIKIRKLPNYIHKSKNHFIWINVSTKKVFHFVHTKKINRPLKNIFYKGKIKSVDLETFSKFLNYNLLQYTDNFIYEEQNKYFINIDYIDKGTKWLYPEDFGLPSYEKGLPFTKSIPYVLVLYGTNKVPNAKFIELKPNIKPNLPDNIILYKYQSVLSNEYNLLWSNNSDYNKINDDFIEI